MTRLILLRHGQTDWNQEGRFRGRADIGLNEVGCRQVELTARLVATKWDPAAIYCSPLHRARQTAEAIAQPLRLHERAHPGLLDIDYGAWQGLTLEEVRQRWPAALQAWFTRPTKAPIPGGEVLETVQLRAMGTIGEIVNRHMAETIVVVGHTVVNRVILLGMLQLPLERFWNLGQDICAVNIITHKADTESPGGNFVLISMNETGHLWQLAGSEEPAS